MSCKPSHGDETDASFPSNRFESPPDDLTVRLDNIGKTQTAPAVQAEKKGDDMLESIQKIEKMLQSEVNSLNSSLDNIFAPQNQPKQVQTQKVNYYSTSQPRVMNQPQQQGPQQQQLPPHQYGLQTAQPVHPVNPPVVPQTHYTYDPHHQQYLYHYPAQGQQPMATVQHTQFQPPPQHSAQATYPTQGQQVAYPTAPQQQQQHPQMMMYQVQNGPGQQQQQQQQQQIHYKSNQIAQPVYQGHHTIGVPVYPDGSHYQHNVVQYQQPQQQQQFYYQTQQGVKDGQQISQVVKSVINQGSPLAPITRDWVSKDFPTTASGNIATITNNNNNNKPILSVQNQNKPPKVEICFQNVPTFTTPAPTFATPLPYNYGKPQAQHIPRTPLRSGNNTPKTTPTAPGSEIAPEFKFMQSLLTDVVQQPQSSPNSPFSLFQSSSSNLNLQEQYQNGQLRVLYQITTTPVMGNSKLQQSVGDKIKPIVLYDSNKDASAEKVMKGHVSRQEKLISVLGDEKCVDCQEWRDGLNEKCGTDETSLESLYPVYPERYILNSSDYFEQVKSDLKRVNSDFYSIIHFLSTKQYLFMLDKNELEKCQQTQFIAAQPHDNTDTVVFEYSIKADDEINIVKKQILLRRVKIYFRLVVVLGHFFHFFRKKYVKTQFHRFLQSESPDELVSFITDTANITFDTLYEINSLMEAIKEVISEEDDLDEFARLNQLYGDADATNNQEKNTPVVSEHCCVLESPVIHHTDDFTAAATTTTTTTTTTPTTPTTGLEKDKSKMDLSKSLFPSFIFLQNDEQKQDKKQEKGSTMQFSESIRLPTSAEFIALCVDIVEYIYTFLWHQYQVLQVESIYVGLSEKKAKILKNKKDIKQNIADIDPFFQASPHLASPNLSDDLYHYPDLDEQLKDLRITSPLVYKVILSLDNVSSHAFSPKTEEDEKDERVERAERVEKVEKTDNISDKNTGSKSTLVDSKLDTKDDKKVTPPVATPHVKLDKASLEAKKQQLLTSLPSPILTWNEVNERLSSYQRVVTQLDGLRTEYSKDCEKNKKAIELLETQQTRIDKLIETTLKLSELLIKRDEMILKFDIELLEINTDNDANQHTIAPINQRPQYIDTPIIPQPSNPNLPYDYFRPALPALPGYPPHGGNQIYYC